MLRTIKKQTHRDFRHRIRRVDPHFYRTGNCVQHDARVSRPVGAAVLGFAWAYLIVSLSQNRSVLETSLQQGNLPEHLHMWIMGGLASFIIVSLVVYGAHLLRFLFQSGARRMNSGSILLGSMAALMMIFIPPEAWKAAFEMLDENSQAIIIAASDSMEIDLPDVTLTDVALVSSRGN